MIAHAPSYYAATANPSPDRPALAGEARAEVCIVGAGFTGISAALELAERGASVVVLEAARVGWGASGRNGGQIVNGYSRELDVIARRYGSKAAEALGGNGAGGRPDHPRSRGQVQHRLRAGARRGDDGAEPTADARLGTRPQGLGRAWAYGADPCGPGRAGADRRVGSLHGRAARSTGRPHPSAQPGAGPGRRRRAAGRSHPRA